MKGCGSRFTKEGGGVRRRKEKHGHSREIPDTPTPALSRSRNLWKEKRKGTHAKRKCYVVSWAAKEAKWWKGTP